jgi:carbamoyltransferase
LIRILGISSHYHDSAAAILVDGQVVAAAQEERFSRKKHDAAMPCQAINYCLREAGIEANQLDYVAYYEKPLIKFERLLETYLHYAPHGNRFFRETIPSWTQSKFFLQRSIRKALRGRFRKRIVYVEHHLSHASTAFYNSPFDEAAVLTVDGVGEWTTTAMGMGQGNRLHIEHELRFPHSLGLLYSAFTAYLGFHVNDGEYKVMGLASYGRPEFKDRILSELMDLRPDGSFRLRMEYFDFCTGLAMFNERFGALFGGPARADAEPITERHQNIASSIQAAIEEVLLRIVRSMHQNRPCENLVLSGGVALNCVANRRLALEGPYDRVWVHGAAGDAGGALGAAQYVWHQLLGKPKRVPDTGNANSLLLGPHYSSDEVLAAIQESRLPYRTYPDTDAFCEAVAEQLENQRIVGWFQGRMEYGPRALGSRSILADARNPEMKERVNATIKRRERFRPFAPAAMAEHAGQDFEVSEKMDCSTMVFTVRAKPTASQFPSVVHVDGTVRIQTVPKNTLADFRRLLEVFYQRTGCPLLINTSFNVKDEPIVCTPVDALRCFESAGLDALAIDRYLILRTDLEQNATQRWTTPNKSFLSRAFRILLGIQKIATRIADMLRIPFLAIAQGIMLVLYLTVLTPIGWYRRRRGLLTIQPNVEPQRATYWVPKSERADAQSHFRQS